MFFKIQQGGSVGMTTYGYIEEAFVRRKDEKFAYNIGYIYGVQYKGIKKRVKAYFKDCPELIRKVKKNEIHKKDAIGIVSFYEENCGE